MKVNSHFIIFPLIAIISNGCNDNKIRPTFNAMAPLHVIHYNNPNVYEKEDWEVFRSELKECREMGLDAISVDVWWGLVEKEGDNIFDWNYYFKVFEEIRSENLGVIPIMSFHSFDPGPDYNFRAPIPKWIWPSLSKTSGLDLLDLKYVSEDFDRNGNNYYSEQYVAHWANEWVMPHYIDFIKSFITTFDDHLKNFREINISCGPTGELRYPSYDGHDKGRYPNRGRMQCFSNLAKIDFINFIGVENSSMTLESIFTDNETLNFFFNKKEFLKEDEIQILFQWYNNSLMKHGNKMLKTAMDNIPDFIPIGFKMPGVHWKINDPVNPRISEMTAGLIDGSTLNGDEAYFKSLSLALKGLPKNRIIFHFTCLEQDNSIQSSDSTYHYSKAKDLVFDAAYASKRLGIKIKGENSLAKNLKKKLSWSRMNDALQNGHYSGLTILRMNHISQSNKVAHLEYKSLIEVYQ